MKIFKVAKSDNEKYKKILSDYLIFIKHMNAEQSQNIAYQYIENIIEGKGFNGEEFSKPTIKSFAERIEYETNGFYTPTTAEKAKIKIGKNKTRNTKNEDKAIEINELDVFKAQLKQEYPFLDGRPDLEDSLSNYCKLSVQVKKALEIDHDKQSTSVKNLIEAQIKLGTYLGISESERQKAKAKESKSSVGDLALQFELTIDEYPELMEMFQYQELRILLNKFERKEISRELFETVGYAGMKIEQAYKFVNENKTKYDRI